MGAIRAGRFSTVRGHAFEGEDRTRARIIGAILCDFRVDAAEISQAFGIARPALARMLHEAAAPFEGLVAVDEAGLVIAPEGRPLARIVARAFDAHDLSKAAIPARSEPSPPHPGR